MRSLRARGSARDEKTSPMPRIQPAELLAFTREVIAALGTPPEAAAEVADHLVGANLAGHDSHGVIRLPQYAEHVRAGKVQPGERPAVVCEASSTALVDGHWTWGQVTAGLVTRLAVAKARARGTAVVAARACYHIGRAGVYALQAAKEGCIALLYANAHGVARVAPWGGTDAKLATNPIAAAVPTRTSPILVDITTSVVAEGKVRLARNSGKPIPEGWVLDRDGRPSTQPADLYEGGTLLPLGGREGHKGYGLSVICDLLGGMLTGAGAGFLTTTVGNGIYLHVTDPEAFDTSSAFLDRVDEYVHYLKSSARKPGVDEILLPGEPELRGEARRRAEGLEIDATTWKQVSDLARSLGLHPPAL
jgi:uncharacterized oxidoreductase